MEDDRLAALEERVATIETKLVELVKVVREHFVKCPGHQDGDPMPEEFDGPQP